MAEEQTNRLHTYQANKYRTPDGYTSDIVIATVKTGQLHVLLIKRAVTNAEGRANVEGGKWAIPGGFVGEHETALLAAARELQEETGLQGIPLTAFGTFDAPGRDPRGWMISQGFYAVVPEAQAAGYQAADDAAEAALFPLQEALQLPLAFDHHEILEAAFEAVSTAFSLTTAASGILPESFTAEQLYETLSACTKPDVLPEKAAFLENLPNLPFLHAHGDHYHFSQEAEAGSIFY